MHSLRDLVDCKKSTKEKVKKEYGDKDTGC